jgi:YesN/AraC family two-component response regulator
MNEKQEKMIELRKQGMTYQEIANVLGCSKSYVGQLIGKNEECKFRPLTEKDCIYVGIRNWMNTNKISKMHFIRLIYGYVHPETYHRYMHIFNGGGCYKSTVDKILSVTGLTYEEAFKLDGDDNGKY